MRKFNPCPFCENTNIKLDEEIGRNDHHFFRARCTFCGTTSGPRETRDRAYEFWNHRPVLPEALYDALAEMVAQYDEGIRDCDCASCTATSEALKLLAKGKSLYGGNKNE